MRLAMGLEDDGLGQPVRPVEGRRPAGEAGQQVVQLRPEPRVVADLVVGGLERLAAHPSASRARTARRSRAPCPTGRPRRPRGARGGPAWGRRGRLAGGDARRGPAWRTGRPATGSLRGRSPGDARGVGPRRDVHADRGHREHGLADVRRVEAAGQGDRDLAGDGGGEGRVDADPGAARVRTTGGVEQDPGRAGVQECPGGARPRRPRRRPRPRAGPWRPGGRPTATADGGSSPLSWTSSGSTAATTRASSTAGQVGGDDDDPRPGALPGRRRAGQPGQLHALVDREGTGRARVRS